MKKLKIKLLYSIFIICSCIFIFYILINDIYQSKYNSSTNYIYGKLLSYSIDGNKLQLEVKGKEKVILFYMFTTEEEKKYYESNLELGDIYKFYGILEEPSSNTNFNLFSYKKYLLSKKIYHTMQVEYFELSKKNSNLFFTIKNKIYKSIRNRGTFPYLSLFIFGNSDALDSKILNIYRNCGISHLIAISGMHISLFSTILLYLLKNIKNDYIKYGIVLIILWIYAFLVGFTSSIMRAVSSFTILSVLKLFNIKVNSLYILVNIFILFLLYNPFYLYNTGFLFSFIISFFLILSKNILSKYKNYIKKVFVISFIAFLASIPIIGTSFYEINLLSPVVNIIFVPFISFLVFPFSLITFIIPYIDFIYKYIITFLEIMVQFSNKYLVVKLVIPYMNLGLVLIYYILLFIIIYFRKTKCVIILFIFIVIYSYQKNFQNHLAITTIDVGQGDSILIELPYNKGNILIDTGGKIDYKLSSWEERENRSISDNILLPYFKNVGIHSIDYLILSHGDYDHMGEAINLVNNFKVEKVIFNCGEFNDLEQELIKVLDKKKIPYYSCIKELNIDNNKLYFLQTKEYDNENDNSNVIYTELNGYKFMFMGDAGVTTEKEILDKYNLPDIDVLKVGHHGSKTSSSKEFINEINPNYSIISVGKNNRYGHPNKEVLNNLKDSKIYRTDQDGSVMFKIKNNKLQIETCSP